MITYQLQQRVVQEAELLFARSSSRALVVDSAHGFSAMLTDHDTGQARAFDEKRPHVPQYNLDRLLPDEHLRADLSNWLQKTCSTGYGWRHDHHILGLQQHRHTTDMAVALWRLATWVDSTTSLHTLEHQ